MLEKYKSKYCLAAVMILLCTSSGFAAVFNVSPSADSNCSDYSCDFQAALDACLSNNGDDNEIHLLQGEYKGNFYYHPSSDNNGDIAIIGGYYDDFNQVSNDPTLTVIDGNASGQVLSLGQIPPVTSGSMIVKNLTIRNGSTNKEGAGLFAVTMPPGIVNVSNNIIESNVSTNISGGCDLTSIDIDTNTGGTVILNNNIIRNNISTGSGNTNGDDGGGAGCFIIASHYTEITNNLIYGNKAGVSGKYWGYGGGLQIPLVAGDVYIINNTITENTVYTHYRDGADGLGGGIALYTDNRGPIAWAESNIVIDNNIIYNNEAETGYGEDIFYEINMVESKQSSISLSNNDYGTFENPFGGDGVSPLFSNNIHVDPKFITDGTIPYSLSSSSPCIDTGNNLSSKLPDNDLSGNLRKWDGDLDGLEVVDMGAYEFGSQIESQQSFAWDLFFPVLSAKKSAQ